MLLGEPYSPLCGNSKNPFDRETETHSPLLAFSFIHACLIMASFPFSVCIICATKAPAAVRDFLMPPSSQMAIQLTLILISCSLYSMYSSSSSSSLSESSLLALLVLVISTCLSLLFANLRKLLRDNTHKANKAPASMEETVTVFQEKSIVPQDEAPEGLMGGSLSDSSECTTNDEEEGTEGGSMSDEADDDDESLIEISLVDGHYVGSEQAERRCAYNYKKDLLAEFLPDLLLDRRDFFDILSEISEEDSLIEIDITRGSIKYSRFGETDT